MLLIHVPKLTNRLGYSLNVIFRHILHVDFSITTDAEFYENHVGAKLNYGTSRVGDGVFIKSCKLLMQTTIEELEPRPFCTDGQWKMFPVYGRGIDFDFDPLAATFFMVSRYEEHLPHREDAHGRFNASESVALEFLDQPVVDQWAMMLKAKISDRYPDFEWPRRNYQFVQTVDIDAAWCYLHKGVFRTVIGTLRDLFVRRDPGEVKRRLSVLLHRQPDPFDTFDYIINLDRRDPGSNLYFFVLLADYDIYDKPASHHNPHFRDLLQHLSDYAHMGIHPGYNVLEKPSTCDTEIKRLEAVLHRPIIRSRYHYLRLRLPMSYRILAHAGIQHDYTMGYADTVGFRAGTCTPYPFYDLERDHETELTIHPFCVMDTTLHKYMRLTPDEAVEQYRRLIASVRAVDGTFCCIMHNQNLSELFGWQGWRRVYEQMLDMAKP